jgi:ATP-dependent DNA helicase PIF1
MSMVGLEMLALVDMRLRQAFPEQQNKPFGNRSVIIMGDFEQLPPVIDDPMYIQKLRHNSLSIDGMSTYKQFQEIYKLDIVQRQSGNSEEQCQFRKILLRLHDGETTIDDWKILTTRLYDSPDVDNRLFSNATYLMPRKVDVDEVNHNKIRSLKSPIAKIVAVHTGHRASKADSNTAKGLEAHLLLARGARIMLRYNLWTDVGLVNGSMGIVQEILFAEGQGPPSLPNAILIEFDNYTGPAITTIEGKKLVPIIPVRQSWEANSRFCSRLQLPISLAWAITVHKSQGLTLPKVIIDFGEKEYAAGLSFVAVFRVRALDDLLFQPFSYERLQKIKKSKRLQDRLNEEKRLTSLIVT